MEAKTTKPRAKRLTYLQRAELAMQAAANPVHSPPQPAHVADVVPQSPGDDPHIARALRYIDDVLTGKRNVCKFVKQACQRQRNDLARFANHPIYYWDSKKASRVCRFVELLPHVKGPLANEGKTITLEDWQCFILTTVFGWRRRDTNGRRYRRSYIEVPRASAKSTISSAIALYGLTSDGESGAEIYSAATTRDQARIIFDAAREMMRKRDSLRARLGVRVGLQGLWQVRDNCSFKALSREASNMDGKNVHMAFIDELHAHKTRDVYDVIETASSKRLASLVWVITTAGSDTSGICYQLRSYVLKILDGTAEDESQFGVVFTLDEDDVWSDPKSWEKANPNWNVSVYADEITNLAQKALQLPSAQANFKTKHLNVWVNADMAWMDIQRWDRCSSPIKLEDFEGLPCIIALDLASKIDIAAKAYIFWKDLGNVETKTITRHYYGFLKCYLPQQAVIDGRNASYEGWKEEGWLTVNPGDVVSYEAIKADLLNDQKLFKVKEVVYDPFHGDQLQQELTSDGFVMVKIGATVKNFSAPMKDFDALVRTQLFHHDGNPILRWMVSNVVCHTDHKENIFPNKERPDNKIDGPVAFIMGFNRALLPEEVSVYSGGRGLRFAG